MLFKKFSTLIYRLITPFFIFRMRCLGISFGRAPIFYGLPQIEKYFESTIQIGDRLILCSDSRYTALALNHRIKIATVQIGARITLGDDVGISGACIICAEKISIGSEVLIGANVLIIDTDFHPITPHCRRFSDDKSAIQTKPVLIEDNVFIGTGAIILKGASISKDSVVAAGAVVVEGEYPGGAILAGNPARIIGSAYER
jgi:acetyltransferase-like isoleucine patch superfamily enzyme